MISTLIVTAMLSKIYSKLVLDLVPPYFLF